MDNNVTSFKSINPENVNSLSEEKVSLLLNKLISDLPKEKRLPYIDILRIAFDFRSINSDNILLKRELLTVGFKFFPIPYNKKLIMGIKRKLDKKS